MIDLKTTGGFITEKRKEKGWDRDALASKLNITPDEIAEWEDGEQFPPQSVLPEFCHLLDIKPYDLLYGGTVDPGLCIVEKGKHISKFDEMLNGEERYILLDHEINAHGKLQDQRLAAIEEMPRDKVILLKKENNSLRVLSCPKDTRYIEVIRNWTLYHLFVNQISPEYFKDKLVISDVNRLYPIPPSWEIPEIMYFNSKTGIIYDDVKGSIITFHLLQGNAIMSELSNCPPLKNIVFRTNEQNGLQFLEDVDYGMVRPDDIFLPELKNGMVLKGNTEKLFQALFSYAFLDMVDANQWTFEYKAEFGYKKNNLGGSWECTMEDVNRYNCNYFKLPEYDF